MKLFFVAAAIAIVTGCSKDGDPGPAPDQVGTSNGGGATIGGIPLPGAGGGGGGGGGTGGGSTDPTAPAGPRDIPTGPKFQTKSAEQLHNAITVCFGGGATLITDEMISGESVVDGVLPQYQGF